LLPGLLPDFVARFRCPSFVARVSLHEFRGHGGGVSTRVRSTDTRPPVCVFRSALHDCTAKETRSARGQRINGQRTRG
jgi:hypothetical protein